jgi:hypothetical protein
MVSIDRLLSVGSTHTWDVFAFCPDDDRNDQREPVDGIDRQHEHRALTRLVSSLDGIQMDEIDLTALNGHGARSAHPLRSPQTQH